MKKQLTRKMTRLCLLCFMLMGITSCSEQSKVEKAAKQFVTALNMIDMDAAYAEGLAHLRQMQQAEPLEGKATPDRLRR